VLLQTIREFVDVHYWVRAQTLTIGLFSPDGFWSMRVRLALFEQMVSRKHSMNGAANFVDSGRWMPHVVLRRARCW
jgi:hypothetical protein